MDSISYFNGDGTLSWWYIQKDVVLFQCQNDTVYSGYLDTINITGFNFYNNEPGKFNEILLNSNTTLADLLAIKDSILASGQLKLFAPVLTKFPYDPNIQQKYYRTDDQLLVTFHNPTIDSTTLYDFMDEYQLKLVREPSSALSNTVSWPYVFELDPKHDTILNTIITCNVLSTFEPLLVKIATPNIIGGEYLSCQTVSEMSFSPGGINGTWHIRNDGNTIWSGLSGTLDADADICECWGAGYTGDGVHIGIIDGESVESDHPDMKPFEAGFDCVAIENIAAGVNKFSANNAHIMAVSGVIGATPNNATGSNFRWAAGVAYDAMLHPFLVSSALSTTQIQLALTQCVEYQMDVVNMSFRIPFDNNISNQITNIVNTTRFANGQYLGIVFVAGSGNDEGQFSNFPANHPAVIGVGMTNPNDYRSSANLAEPWTANAGTGSTYGPPDFNYDVVSPGEVIMTLDLQGALGYSPGSYIVPLAATSFSTPIVSGIAAILLEKNPNLTYTEVRDLIRNGADKVRPTTYNYNMFSQAPGYNNEMFYGRVNCLNSLNLVLGVHENVLQQLTLLTVFPNNYVLMLPENSGNQRIEIINTLGQKVWENQINSDQYQVEFSLEKYASGAYFLNLYENEQIIGNTKLIK